VLVFVFDHLKLVAIAVDAKEILQKAAAAAQSLGPSGEEDFMRRRVSRPLRKSRLTRICDPC
jgi:hypothetical protein